MDKTLREAQGIRPSGGDVVACPRGVFPLAVEQGLGEEGVGGAEGGEVLQDGLCGVQIAVGRGTDELRGQVRGSIEGLGRGRSGEFAATTWGISSVSIR